MPNQERSFSAGGKSYTLRFTQNALYRLQKQLGRPLHDLASNTSAVEVQTMLWAGLEGARLKHLDRREPFTIDEAGDIIDELGGLAAAAHIVVDALRIAILRDQASQNGTSPESSIAGTAKE